VLGDDGSGYVSDAITAYTYAARNGAGVVNASFGGPSFSRAEHDAIAAASNTLFVVAAGNDGANNDVTPEYPCDYDLANVVCVAASDHDDALAVFSNYGTANVDLAAPGVDIASTWPGGRYALLDGTSMATPHVAGAAALVLAHDGTLGVAALRAALLSSVHPVAALAGRVATGGRLDVAAALSAPPAPAAPAPVASVPPIVVPTEAASVADRLPPGVSLRIDRGTLRTIRVRGLRLALGASEACRARIDVGIDARSARAHRRSRGRGGCHGQSPWGRARGDAAALSGYAPQAVLRTSCLLPDPADPVYLTLSRTRSALGLRGRHDQGKQKTCQSPRCSRSAGAILRIDRLDRLLRPTWSIASRF